jgi:DNA-binding transcriptional regulator YhcF (GntR family)
MRLWLKRNSDVNLREQLSTQIILGILCNELPPGERLPSTRELAQRHGIHPNTASAAYQELENQGWLEVRHGSGVYVRATQPSTPLTPEIAVDQLIANLVARARKLGADDQLVRARIARWLDLAPPARWLLIEPDAALCEIVLTELSTALELPMTGCTPEECADPAILAGAMPIVLPSKAAMVRALLPPGTQLTTLRVHPIAPELQVYLKRYLPQKLGSLVGIASHWSEFQRFAQVMLVAAGLPADTLLVRDANETGWERGLEATVGVVVDSVTERELPAGVHPMRFTLLDADGMAQLRAMEAASRNGAGAAETGKSSPSELSS